MNQAEIAAVAESVAEIVKAYGAKHVEPLIAENAELRNRLKALEDRVAMEPIRGEPGKDADPVDVEALFARLKAEIPAPLKGDPGKDGDHAPAVDVAALLREIKELIPAPLKGDKGDPGNSSDPVDIDSVVAKVLQQIPVPKNGEPGKDGENAPAVDVAAIVETVRASIPIPKNGEPGKDGTSIELPAVKSLVYDAVADVVKTFPFPRDGRPGDPGKDALEITIQRGMNESASYQFGSWVAHRNGIFRAYRTTDPVQNGDFVAAGWDCVIAGITDMRTEIASDQRTFLHTAELSDGKSIVSKVKPPHLVYRGVFRDGITYEKGDSVQWGGNSWHANQTTTERPKEDAKDWGLMTRRGRDGKDLEKA